MAKKRDTSTYKLVNGRKTVYIGTSNNLEKRAAEHEAAGKKFTDIKKTSSLMSPESAKEREAEQLKSYRNNHEGKNPKYNKDSDG